MNIALHDAAGVRIDDLVFAVDTSFFNPQRIQSVSLPFHIETDGRFLDFSMSVSNNENKTSRTIKLL